MPVKSQKIANENFQAFAKIAVAFIVYHLFYNNYVEVDDIYYLTLVFG